MSDHEQRMNRVDQVIGTVAVAVVAMLVAGAVDPDLRLPGAALGAAGYRLWRGWRGQDNSDSSTDPSEHQER